MALRRREGQSAMHLSLLLTCLLLITGGAQGNEVVEVETAEGGEGIEEGGGDGGSGVAAGDIMTEGVGGVVVAENGTAEAVVLDCPYHLDEKDLAGLHIKWYHQSDFSPVYQWIPSYEPRAMRILQDRVDLTYEASPDALNRYRALRILSPTTELAGSYLCRVSSFTADLSYTQELVVFREPSGLDVRVEVLEEDQVAVICKVEEVYPQPVLQLYKKSSSKDSEALTGGTPVTSSSKGTYDMEVEKVVEEVTLDGPTEFECHMTIPNTELRIVTSTMYQPRVSFSTYAVTGGSSTQRASIVTLVVFLFVFLLHY